MLTMLDCIKRSPILLNDIVDNINDRNKELLDFLGDSVNDLSKIYLIGSGTSNTASIASKQFMEKVTGLEVETYVPNMFNQKSIYDSNALCIFTSQSGTSSLVKQMIAKMNSLNIKTVAICGSKDTPIGMEANTFVNMGCGFEEYSYRTIGYVTSILTLMTIALCIGLKKKCISEKEYNEYLDDARKAINNHAGVVDNAVSWYEKNESVFEKARTIIIYGTQGLYGVALEGALKILEISKTYFSVGYELEDGLHGPNLGYTKDDVIIALDNNTDDEWMIQSVVNFGKHELNSAFVFGKNVQDENDLLLETKSDYFQAIEFAAAVQVLAYELAGTANMEIPDATNAKKHASFKYFQTHRG